MSEILTISHFQRHTTEGSSIPVPGDPAQGTRSLAFCGNISMRPSNLYGIIPLGKLYEIISSQSRRPMSEDVFRAFAEIAKHECEDYCILGDVDLTQTAGRRI